MNKIKFAALLTGLGLLLVQTPSFAGAIVTNATRNEPQYVQGEVLVKFKPGAAAGRAQLAQAYGASRMQTVGNQADLVLANLIPGRTVEQAVSAFANDPNVEYAQPNYIYHATAVPTDPNYSKLWAAKNTGQRISPASYAVNNPPLSTGNDMNLESAWDIQTDCRSVVVAVVDTGINYNTEDLAANIWTDPSGVDTKHGRNFAPDVATGVNSDPMDIAGHGTHVAGIIGAVANNATISGTDGVGVCWQANLMAVRVLDAAGYGTTTNIILGIDYAIAKGAKIINMSLGSSGGTGDPSYSAAITRAQNANVLVVVAAGNDGLNNDSAPQWPCNFTQSNLICVAALDQNYALANFSNYGATSVDVGAPGTNIYSTWAGTSNMISDNFSAGWTYSSTTPGTGGGWVANTYGATTYLEVPGVSWGVSKYNASTDDRAYKNFNLAGVNGAYLEESAAINVNDLDYFLINYSSVGGDPSYFSGSTGSIAKVYTKTHDGTLYVYQSGKINITPCISATCTVGVQLLSNATTPKDFGVTMTNFKITTMTNTTDSYNTIDGTSMATPEVAGVAALVWAHNPAYTYADVANAIKNGGRTVTALNGKTTTGKAVDAMGSLSYINPPTGIAVTVQ